MATTAVPLEPQSRAVEIVSAASFERWPFRTLLVAGLSVFAVALQGYHPYAEDGGLYAAGVERLLDPTLFPHWSNFVLAPMRVSAFAPSVAALVRISHFSFPVVLLTLHLITIWATLYSAWGIAEMCWRSVHARAGAVVLLACWLGLPVAGTSLQVMDPYVTARSLSTPCTLFALLCVLRATSDSTQRKHVWWILCLASLTLATAMHPLMAGYSLGAMLLLYLRRSIRPRVQFACTIACCTAVIAVAALLNYQAAAESAAYVRAALTRNYWFPAQWAWYELIGLIAPLAIVATYSRSRASSGHPYDERTPAPVALSGMATVLGTTAILVALLFSQPNSHSHLVARLQPLRAFQIVYVVMILSLGAMLGEHVLKRRTRRWAMGVLFVGAPVFFAQRATYPSSRHIQISEANDENPWIQSFAWVRTHTPKDALFALDPDYIHAPGEDGQCFRAIAQRSALPDFSKDGGEASIAPQLAETWQLGLHAEQNLGTVLHLYRNSSDASALRAAGVSWVILGAKAHTDFNCPYSNAAAKVCTIL